MGTFVIAEAGVNHNGDMSLAKKMVDVAAAVGVDCIKFQTFRAESLVSKTAAKADYQIENTGASESQLDMIRKLELSYDNFRQLQHYCAQKDILFLSTPFDLESIDFLESIGIPFWKIPSGEITNYPYLVRIAKIGQDIVLSTGMSELSEISAAVKLLRENGCGKITLLHCNTEYPTPFEDVNLSAIRHLRQEFGLDVGYSDHTCGIEISIAAAAMGACIIEKHFTLDKNMPGPDHKASLNPEELAEMVRSIRNVEKAMGDGKKRPSPSELKNKDIARKSIVASCNICKGELLSEENLTTKRPGNGISPMRWNTVLGSFAAKDFKEDELIEL